MSIKVVVDRTLPAEQQLLLKMVCALVDDLILADGSSVMLMTSPDTLSIRAASGDISEPLENKIGITLKIGERVAGRCAQDKKPILVTGDVAKDGRFGNLTRYQNINSGLSVPIIKNGKVLGVINAKRTKNPDPLAEKDLQTVEIIAGNLAKVL